MTFEEVEAIAVSGSVAKPLWKEVPRFREFRRAGIEVWHAKDLDLAMWISSQLRLAALRRARDLALRRGCESGKVQAPLIVALVFCLNDRFEALRNEARRPLAAQSDTCGGKHCLRGPAATGCLGGGV
jgi:hypothetical protein